ncbi:hypothetical protein C0J50_22646 [Silurus asotus]|uniref:Gypsy retrotransposon integrase-like protein 1 n=1 Tax=Silurus asotus TaxID=30991 RepID=A0AAD5FJT2_SILAS|nr:hypothetical protein C0J50_22646 [Silurus asotus]
MFSKLAFFRTLLKLPFAKEKAQFLLQHVFQLYGLAKIDEDLTEFLNKYGRVDRHIRIDDPKSPYHKEVIVEYSSGSALVTLKPLLPYTFKSPHNVVYHVRLLSNVYMSAITEHATAHYFDELKRIAKLSGRTFDDLVKEQLLSATVSVDDNLTDSPQMINPSSSDIPFSPKQTDYPEKQNSDAVHSLVMGNFSPAFEVKDVNPPEVQRMVVEHIVKSDCISPSNASFRLRVFSGKVPCPTGEADYDTWRNTVELILQDPSLSDLHRSRRILDSLLPPASEIVKQLGAKALPAAYLNILDSAFDTVEDGDDLFAKFLNMLQNASERPSLYLQRLHTNLLKVIKRGGISADEADRQLLKQFSRGCWNDTLITNLQLEHKRNRPPLFPDLLLQLRSEEDKHFAKESRMRQHLGIQRQKASSHIVNANPLDQSQNEMSEETEVAELKRQVAKLQSQLAKQRSKQTGQSMSQSTNAVLELKEQVTELQSQMSKLKVPRNVEPKGSSSKMKHANTRSARENPPIADYKLHHRPRPGYCFRCGSQVTTISQSFYEQNLPGLSITSLNNLLEVQAANGQSVPYLGYVEVKVTFPRDFLGSDVEVSTLALVIPETGGTAQPKVLIGTNTLDLAYDKYLKANSSVCQAIPFGYRAVIQTIEYRCQQKENSNIGIGRLPGALPVVVPAGQNVVLEGVVSVRGQVAERWAVMEPPLYSPFPGGLLVASCLLNLPQHPSRKVPVVIKNETEHDVIIPGKSVIADIHALQKVMSHNIVQSDCSASSVCVKSVEDLCFDFGDSCLPEEWKRRITQKLCAMPEVFALHDMDVGQTDKVKHSIKLHDETPFKHIARPIHPNDLEAVRRHLEELLEADTLEEHEQRLLHVLGRLKDYGLKLSLEKCKFFQQSVKYLGHIVSENGVETDPQKIEAIKTWPSPRNLKELRSFLGFSGYYRRFIKDYAKLVKPLNELTVGYPPFQKSRKVRSKEKTYLDPKEPFGGRWTTDCQRAFETLITKLTEAPVLGFADPGLPYVLHTDASTTGLVTEKFCDYLYGSSFKVITDSNPLTYVLTSAKLDATSYRWLSALSTFSFTLQYHPGKNNLDADALSRRPHGDLVNDSVSQKEQDRIRQFTLYHSPEAADSTLVPTDVIQAICDKHSLCHVGDNSCITLVESLSMCPEAIPKDYELMEGSSVVPCMSERELKEKQRNDPAMREVIFHLESGDSVLPALRRELPELPFLLRERRKLELKDGVLYRKRTVGDCTIYQLVLPPELRAMTMESLHDNMGHMGIERTLDLILSRFYWPKMATDIENKIKTCSRCVCRKALPERAAPLVNIQVTRPLELVCMDFLSLEPDRSNTKDVLVITDCFTKYAVAVPTPNQKARTVAKSLWENFIVHYGVPEKLHSDQGPDFESKTIKELCDIAGIKKVRTTPYHPRGNPLERFNRTLLGMLGTLKAQDKTHWKDFVKPLVHAYNCTKHETTGFTPYELMFGRQPRLPVDLIFNTTVNRDSPKLHSQYVQSLKTHLQESYKLAQKNAAKTAERNKVRFDRKVTESSLEEGDRVLVRNVRLRGKHKLADRWDPVVHIVVSRADGEDSMTKPQEKHLTRQSRVEDTDECLENCQSSDEDDYAPQISEVPAITSERFIREYNVIRKPTEVPLNDDPTNRISPNLTLVPSDDLETVNAGDVSRDDLSEPEFFPATGLFPFHATNSYLSPIFSTQKVEGTVPSAGAWVNHCNRAWQRIRAALFMFSMSYAFWANRRCRPAPAYHSGQRIWLSTKDLPPTV